jgi:hypothetical protein
MKLEFHFAAFAAAVRQALNDRGWSYAQAIQAAPFLNSAMLSRAVNERHVSLTSFIAVCAALGLDPFGFCGGWSHGKFVEIQPVTAAVPRETFLHGPAEAGRAKGGTRPRSLDAFTRPRSPDACTPPPRISRGEISAETLAWAKRTLGAGHGQT